MLGSSVLDVVIGLSYTFALLSALASALNEVTAALLALRAKTLRAGVADLLGDVTLRDEIYAHPLISGVSHGGRGPSYVARSVFALALIDAAVTKTSAPATTPTTPPDLSALRAAFAGLPERPRRALCAVVDETVKDVAGARAAIESWFDAGMGRVSGAYKRRAHVLIAAWAVILAVGLNADAFAIAQTIGHDPALGEHVAAMAEAAKPPASGDASGATTSAVHASASVAALEVPLGWHGTPRGGGLGWASKILGLLVTALAISLGAPFWFDILGRFTNLRATGKREGP